MTNTTNLATDVFGRDTEQDQDIPRIGIANQQYDLPADQTYSSGTSWGAIFAGASASAALGLILILLGVGLGLSFVSPWANSGMSATAFGLSTIIWLIITQILAYGAGGYLAGRLRVRWKGVASDEVYFRDTAHGFLTWAVASLATAVFLTSVIGSIIGIGAQAGASVASSALNVAQNAHGPTQATTFKSSGNPNDLTTYYVSSLFRKNMDATAVAPEVASTEAVNTDVSQKSEIVTIFMNTIHRGELPAADTQYVGELISERTGLSQLEAEKRVITAYSALQTKLIDVEMVAKDAANAARKASAHIALWLFISLLIGAFVASVAAIYGGRCRDN